MVGEFIFRVGGVITAGGIAGYFLRERINKNSSIGIRCVQASAKTSSQLIELYK